MTKAPKKTALRLSNSDKWKIATYCIENRCVVQDIKIPEHPFTEWRVGFAQTVKEINNSDLNLPEEINVVHVKGAIEFYNEVCILTNKMPVPPPVQDTVREDMLVAELSRLKIDLTNLTAQNDAAIKALQHVRFAVHKIATFLTNNVPA